MALAWGISCSFRQHCRGPRSTRGTRKAKQIKIVVKPLNIKLSLEPHPTKVDQDLHANLGGWPHDKNKRFKSDLESPKIIAKISKIQWKVTCQTKNQKNNTRMSKEVIPEWVPTARWVKCWNCLKGFKAATIKCLQQLTTRNTSKEMEVITKEPNGNYRAEKYVNRN